ncbi:MAG: lipopolysaccharide biosynthesis protein [Candidatus Babeliales bacterium]
MSTSLFKRQCTNTFFFGATAIFTKGIWLIAMPTILNKLTVHDVGVFDFYQSIFLIGSLMISSLTAQPLLRFYLKHRNEPDLQRATIGASSVIIALCTALCFVFAALTFARYSFCGDCYYVMFLFVNAGLFACFSCATSFYQIRERIQEYVLLYSAQSILALALVFTGLRLGYGMPVLFWANSISYLLCMPALRVFFTHIRLCDTRAVYEQLVFGMPLFAYNILYMLLFAVDRWYLAATQGYEIVGVYAILWYFGRIFVYGTLALYEASPILLYNVQHEHDGNRIIARTIKYITLAYVTGALMVTPCAYILLSQFLPAYKHLICYVPLFITPLLFIETGKFWQAGFNLATQTKHIPFITLSTLLLQLGGLYFLGQWGLVGVLYANGFAFMCYALMNAVGSAYIYDKMLFDVRELGTMFVLYGIYTLFFWYALSTPFPIVCFFVGAFTWPIVLWFSGVLSADEKVYILQIFKKMLPVA